MSLLHLRSEVCLAPLQVCSASFMCRANLLRTWNRAVQTLLHTWSWTTQTLVHTLNINKVSGPRKQKNINLCQFSTKFLIPLICIYIYMIYVTTFEGEYVSVVFPKNVGLCVLIPSPVRVGSTLGLNSFKQSWNQSGGLVVTPGPRKIKFVRSQSFSHTFISNGACLFLICAQMQQKNI